MRTSWLLLAAGLCGVLLAACASDTTSAPDDDDAVDAGAADSSAPEAPQDWAALGHFAEANAALPAPPTSGEARVVFMGNSITEGWDHRYPEFFRAHPNWINRGISGQTTPQMLVRFRPDVIDLAPEAVVILAGINDIAGNTGPMTLEQTFGNLASMAQLARANGIRVVLASVLPAYDFPWSPGKAPAQKVVRLNAMLKDFAAATEGVSYLDYFTPMADGRPGLREGLHEDEVHPLRAGYELMRPLTEQAVSEALE